MGNNELQKLAEALIEFKRTEREMQRAVNEINRIYVKSTDTFFKVLQTFQEFTNKNYGKR